MSPLPIDFIARVSPSYCVADGMLLPETDAWREVRPLELQIAPPIYAKFAALDGSPQAFLDFAAAFGPLTHDGDLAGERLADLETLRLRMSTMIEWSNTDPGKLLALDASSSLRRQAVRRLWERAADKVNAGISAKHPNAVAETAQPFIPTAAANVVGVLRPGAPDGRPVLALRADTLWDAMLLQFYQAVTVGARVKPCEWCGGPLEVGATGKRSGARFCSDACRVRHHRSRKETSNG